MRPSPAKRTGSDTPARPNRSLRLLIVDDDVDSGDALAELFTLEEHYVQLARDGDRALEIALSWRPDVIFMDMELLPGMSGCDVARAILRHGLRTHLIALTGRGMDGDQVRPAEAGFELHRLKPTSLEEIAGVVEACARELDATQAPATSPGRERRRELPRSRRVAHRCP